jgi:DNA repair protein RecO (recombination protein O)
MRETMDDTIEVTGVVSFSAPVGEYDRRLVLLTRELGRITVFAGGARRPTCPYIAACRAFTFARFTLNQGRSAYRLKSAQIVESFEALARDFDAVSYGTYFLELGGYFSEENVEAEELVNLLFVTFKALLKPAIPKKLVRCIFELRVLAVNGEAPQVFNCVSCGKPLTEGSFSVRRHGLLCGACQKEEGLLYIPPACAVAMEWAVGESLGKLYTFSVSEEVLSILCQALKQYYSYYVPHHFKSLDLILD